jgi:1,2-diacylglycerol 3-beta-glucosyltransferase
MIQVILDLGVACIVLALAYLAWGMIGGWRQLRSSGSRLGTQSELGYGHPHQPEADPHWFVYFLVPCLNEEAVIGNTVAGLIGSDRSHTVVIDDGSDDATGELATQVGGSQVTVLRRQLPNARQGKGEALNYGYAWLRGDVGRRGLQPEEVLVCVMDADGRLSDGALAAVVPCFDDPAVGAVQLAVRIRNRERFLTAYQDYLFFCMAALSQFARITTGSVSLGGNGQFTRLNALIDLGGEPWSRSLTEDLDLGIRLGLAGWRATSTPLACVDQQGVVSLGRLVRQRTRWYQGHMAEGAYIPKVWRASKLPTRRALEFVAYLSIPWLLDLPWSILFQVSIFKTASTVAGGFGVTGGGIGPALLLVGWFLASFAPQLGSGIVYYRRDRQVGLDQALLFGVAIVAFNYVAFLCCWWALFRLVRRKESWAKTSREVEANRYDPATLAG